MSTRHRRIGSVLRPRRWVRRARAQATYLAVYALLGSFIVVASVASSVVTAPPAQAAETLRTFSYYGDSSPSASFNPWSYGTPTRMRVRMHGARGGYGGLDCGAGCSWVPPGNAGYVETTWFSPMSATVYPGRVGLNGATCARGWGGGAGGTNSYGLWNGGLGGNAGGTGCSGGGGGGGAGSAVAINGGWLVAAGSGGGGGNGNFGYQSWMVGRSWHSSNGSWNGNYGGDPGGADGGGGGGGGGGWWSGNGGGVAWTGREYGGGGGYNGSNNNTAGLGIAASDYRWNGGHGYVFIDVYYASVPSVPTSVRVSSVGDRQATIAWGTPSDTGGLSLSDYQICWGTTTSASTSCATTGSTSYTVSSLTNGTTHYFKVRASNSVGWGAYSSVVSALPRTVPSAPPISVTEGNGQLAISWVAPSNNGAAITDYIIQFKLASIATYSTWNDGVSTATSTTITGLSNGSAYDVHVAAVNAAGTGAFSTAMRGTPFTTPGAPTAVQITRASDTSLSITWTPPSSNGGKAITKYWLERATGTDLTAGPTSSWTGIGTQPSEPPFVDTGLSAGTIYYYRVRADNGLLSAWSTATAARLATVPGTPATPTVTPLVCTDGTQAQSCSGTVDLSWPATSNGGAAISEYRVQYSAITAEGDTNYSWVTATPTFSGTTTITARVTGLSNGVTYAFRVSAINVVGQGSWSTPSGFSSTLRPRTVPGAPTGVVVTGSGDSFADLAWTAPSSDGGVPLVNYRVEYSSNNDGTWTTFATRPTGTSVRVTGLTNGLTYIFRVAAGNASGSAGATAYSTPTASSNDAKPLTTPAAATVTLQSTDAQLNVTAVVTDTGGTPITGWEYSLNNGAWVRVDNYTVTGSTYTFAISNLVNGTNYDVRTRAINAVGVGAVSTAQSNIPYRQPDVPTNLNVSSQQDRAILLTWSAPASNGGNAISSYTVEYRTGSGNWSTATHAGALPPVNGLLIGNLTNGLTYEFRVFATNARGNSAVSTVVTGIPRTTPGAPATIQISNQGDQQLTVTWTAPSTDGGNALVGYVIEYSSNSFATTSTATVSNNALSFVITGLVNGTQYSVRVRAVNAAGTGAATNAVNGTPRTIPAAPQAVTVSGGVNSVLVTWQAPPSDGGNAITDYVIEYSANGTTWGDSATAAGSARSRLRTGLTPTTSLFMRVAAVNAAGQGPWATSSVAAMAYGAATPPVINSVTQGNGQVVVRFDATNVVANGSPVTGFRVTTWDATGTTADTAVAPCTTSTPVSSGSTVYECIVTGLTNKESYTFKVQSVNAAGPGDHSLASSQIRPGTTPQTITVVTPTGVSAGDRAWALNATASSGLPVSYAITSAVGICSFVGASSQGLISPDAAGVCEVVVTQDGANSSFDVAPAKTVTFTINPSAPSAPRITSVQASAAGAITVDWVAPTYAGGTRILHYVVTVTPPLPGSAVTTNPITSGTTTTITGLGVGAHTVTVTAYNESLAAGQVAFSATSMATSVVVYGTPGAPTNVAAATGDRSLTVSWTGSGVNAGLPITSFTATAKVGNTVAGTCSTAATATSCVITGLVNDTEYNVTVTETHAYLSGPASAAASGTAGELPQTVTITAAAPSTSWATGLTTTVSGSSSVGLPVTYSVTGASTSICSVDTRGTVSLTRAGECVVTATAIGAGNAYATASGTTTITVAAVAPSAPVIGQFRSATGSGSLRLTWTAPATDGGAAITSYTAVLSLNSVVVDTQTVTLPATTAIEFTGLANGSYSVALTATNSASQTGSAANAAFALIVASTPPQSVTAVTGDRSLTVSWTAPSDLGGATIITGYRVTATAAGLPSATCVTAGTTTCVLTGLAQDREYSITVTADNGSFVSAASTAVSATTGQLAQALVWETATVNGAGVTGLDLTARTGAIAFSQGSVRVTATSRVADGGGAATAALTGATVTFSTASTACTVTAAGVVTPVRAGTCVITADQNGTDNAYAAAASLTFTLTINQVLPTAPVRTSWTFTPTTAATTETPASRDGKVRITYQVPDTVALGGGQAYVLSATIGGQTVTCANNVCEADFTFPDGATVATVTVSDTIAVTDVASDGVAPTAPATTWNASGAGSITLTLFRPDPAAPEQVTLTSNTSGTQITAEWKSPSYTGNGNITSYSVTLIGPNGIVRQTVREPSLDLAYYSYVPTDPARPPSLTDATFIGSTNVLNVKFDVGTENISQSNRSDHVILVYSGWWTPTFTGTQQIRAVADDGVRIYLNDVLVYDDWLFKAASGITVPIQTTSGVPIKFRLEYFDETAQASLDLQADNGTGTTFTTIPGEQFTRDVLTDSLIIQALTDGGDSATSNRSYSQTFAASPSTDYVVRVNAINSSFTSNPAGAVVTTPSAPSAPLSVRATAKANGVVDLTWTAPASNGGQPISGYTVTGAPAGGTITQPAGTSTSASVTGLTPFTTYTFSVVATNAVGNSSAASVEITAIDVPAAPTVVAGSTEGQAISAVSVTWTASAVDNGSAITGYRVEIAPAAGGDAVAQRIVAANATSAVLTGIPRGQYVARVVAVNAAGVSTAGVSTAFTVSRTQTITVSLNGTAVTTGTATYDITATPLVTALASAGSAVTLSIASGDSYCSLTDGLLSFNPLGNATSRECVVRAATSEDTVYEAATTDITITVTAVRPSAPRNVVLTPGNGSITVAWDAPASNGGADLIDYTVEYRIGGAESWTPVTHTGATPPAGGLLIETLTNGTAYDVRVTANNGVTSGSAVPSAAVSATPRTVPSAPTLVSAVNTQVIGQVEVTWTRPGSDGGSPITSYTATVLSGPNGTVLGSCTVVSAVTRVTCLIGGLKRGDGYDVTVVATNAAGSSEAAVLSAAEGAPSLSVGVTPTITFTNGTSSEPLTGITADYGAPAQRIFATSTSGAAVSFTVVNQDPATSATLASGTPCVITDGVLSVGEFLLKAGQTSTTCIITATTAADDVYIAGSQTITVTVNAVGPDAPDPVQLIPGSQSITITWTVPVRVGGAPITSYVVEYTRVFSGDTPQFTGAPEDPVHLRGSVTVLGASTRTATVTGLLNGYAYAVRVAAINAAGRGEWDPIATPSGKPLPVRGVGASETPTVLPGDRVITVSWRAPINAADKDDPTITYFGDGGSPITGYTVIVTRTVGQVTETYTCAVQPQSDPEATLSCSIAVPLNKVEYTVSVGVTNVNGTTTTDLGGATPVANQTLAVTASGTAAALTGTATELAGNFTYGSTVTLTATATSGLAASFATTTPDSCSVTSSGVVTASKAGPCVVVVSQGGDDIFNAATSVTVTFEVLPNLVNAAAAISAIGSTKATVAAAIPWAGADVTVTFEICTAGAGQGNCTTTSGGTVTSSTTAMASGVVENLLPSTEYFVRTVISAGTSTSTSPSSSFTTLSLPTVTTAAPELTALTPIQITLTATGGTGTFSTWSVLAPGTLPEGLTLDAATGVLSGTPTSLTPQTVTITVTDSGGNTGQITYSLTVQGASPNLAIAPLANRSYSPTPLALSVSAVDLTYVTYASSDTSVCTVDATTGVVTMQRQGTCTITATSTAHGLYAAATETVTFQISRAAQTISFPEIANRTYAPNDSFSLSASASSGLTVTFASSTLDVCTVAGATVSVLKAGTCTITALQRPTGDDAQQYADATDVIRTFAIERATPTIVVTSSTQIAYLETATVEATVTGGGTVSISLQAGTASGVTVDGLARTIVANVADSQVTIRISAAQSDNYAAGFIDVVFTLVRAQQSITLPNLTDASGDTVTVSTSGGATQASITYAPNRVIDLRATANSNLPVTYVSTDPSVAVVSNNVITVVGAGSATIKVDQAGQAGSYLPAAQREVTLTVNQAEQGFSLPAWPMSATFGDAPVALQAANIVPGRAVNLTSQTPGVCRVTAQGALDIIGVGTCTIEASEPGDANYLAAASLFTVEVARATRTIAISSDPAADAQTHEVSITYLNEEVALNFEASAEDENAKTVTLNGPCTWDGAVITATGAGVCTVTVTVAQGLNYLPATTTLTINVAKAPQRITNIVKGTDPQAIVTPAFPQDVLSWSVESLEISVGSSVTSGQQIAVLRGQLADGEWTADVSVTASAAGVVSRIRDLSEAGSDVGLGEGDLLAVVESLRSPTTSASIDALELPEGATSWAVTSTTAVGSVVDTGQVAVRIRPQVTVATNVLPEGATSWRVTLNVAAGDEIAQANATVATATPQRRIVAPGLPTGTSAWSVGASTSGSVTAGATVVTLLPERVLRAPALPEGATTWSISATPTAAPSSADDVVVVLIARDAQNVHVGNPVNVFAGIAGTVVSGLPAGTNGVTPGDTLAVIHGAGQAMTTPLAGDVSSVPAQGTLVAPGTLVAIVSGLGQSLISGGMGEISAINPDLEVMSAGEVVLRVRGAEQALLAAAGGTVTTNKSVESTVGGGEPILIVAAPRADSRNNRLVVPELPATAPDSATFTVVSATANSTAVLAGDVLITLAIDAPAVSVNTPPLPSVSESTPVGAASFSVESIAAVGTTMASGDVVAVLRAIGTDNQPFETTIDVLAPISGTIAAVGSSAGATGLLADVPLVSMTYAPFAVASPVPGRILTTTAIQQSGLATGDTLAYVEETLRFGQVQLLTATKGPSQADVVYASTTPDICEIVDYLGGKGVRALGVGTCVLTIDQEGDDNYLAAPTEFITILIDRAEQDVSVAVSETVRYGDDPVTPVVRAADGAAITLVSNNESVLTIENGQLVPVGVGSAGVTVIAGSTDFYNQSAPVRETVTVEQGIQTIAVLVATSGTEGDRLTVSAAARSGLPVVVTSTTPGVCSVAGFVVSLIGAGSCIINAEQEGSPLWLPADTVVRTIAVSARPLVGGGGPGVLTLTAPAEGRATTVDLRTIADLVDATVAVSDVSTRAAGMVSLTDGVLRIDPAATFSGIIRFNVRVTRGDVVETIAVQVTVPATNPLQVTFEPQGGGVSRISWEKSPNAVSYIVTVNGEPACLTPRTTCNTRVVLGPKSVVEVQAVGGDSVFAVTRVDGDYQGQPGRLISTATLSGTTVTKASSRRIGALASQLVAGGYEQVSLVVAAGPSEKRSAVRAKIAKVASLFKRTTGLAVSTRVVKATPAQVRQAARKSRVPSAAVQIRLVVPVSGPRLG